MSMRGEMERLISTALHCNPVQFPYGIVTGTTIIFGYKFVDIPCVMLTPFAAAGGATCGGISLDKDEGGYYVGATIESAGCDFIGWIAIGTGIAVTT